jgi:Protein of unknown function (DUF559)
MAVSSHTRDEAHQGIQSLEGFSFVPPFAFTASLAPRVKLNSSSPCKGSAASRSSRTPEKTTKARRLRRDATKAERKLWYVLQRKQMAGQSFRRQHPLGRYFVDFYWRELSDHLSQSRSEAAHTAPVWARRIFGRVVSIVPKRPFLLARVAPFEFRQGGRKIGQIALGRRKRSRCVKR